MDLFQFDFLFLALFIISFIAFFLKGVTGTGTATVTIALSSFVIDPKSAVVLASLINIFGGLAMIKIDPVPLARKFWLPTTVMMILGSFVGAMALHVIDNEVFQIILGGAFFLVSFWFLLKITPVKATISMKEKATFGDYITGAFAGFCGGFIGVNAPPLILHFGRFLNKAALRRLLVIIFIPAAFTQTGTFAVNGLLTYQILTFGIVMLPGMIIGIYLGNKSFHFISDGTFKKILGILLLIVSIRLIYFGLF